MRTDNDQGLRKEPFSGSEEAPTERIIGVFYEFYNELGCGFLESIYCRSMAIALEHRNLSVATEVAISVSFRGQFVGSFRADLVVERKIVLEVKTADAILKAHEAQLIDYLRSSSMEIGFVLNFGSTAKLRRMELRNEGKRNLASMPSSRP